VVDVAITLPQHFDADRIALVILDPATPFLKPSASPYVGETGPLCDLARRWSRLHIFGFAVPG
jgi:hypothetical protein